MAKKAFSEETLQIARNTDIADFCVWYGLPIKKIGSGIGEKPEYCLIDNSKHGTDKQTSCHFSANVFQRFSSGQKGDIIDFVAEIVLNGSSADTETFRQAVELIMASKGLSPNYVNEVPQKPSALNLKPINTITEEDSRKIEIEFADNEYRAIAYLNKTRMIDMKFINPLLMKGIIRQDTRGNCVFCRYATDGSLIGVEKHGTGLTKFKQTIGKKGIFLQISPEIKTICVFETMIDLLSFYEIYADHLTEHLLLSMGGLNDVSINEAREMYPEAKVFLCVDNDYAGNKFISNRCPPYIKYQTKDVKDWNELLVLHKKK